MSKRVMARIPDDTAALVEKYAEQFGLSQSQLMGMAIQAGMGQIIRSIRPEEALSPSQWADIVEEMDKRGYKLEENRKLIKE